MVATGSFLVLFQWEKWSGGGMNLHKCVYLRVDSDFSESSSELCPRDSVAALGGVDRYVETARHGHSVIGRVTRHGVVWFAKWLDESHRDLAESRLRLRKEYQILLRLNHPGVVRAAGLEENPQTGLALMMELAEGEMLGDFLQHATRAQRSEAAMRLLEGAAYIHSKGVCHLDLKPENVMVSVNGRDIRVKIIDFGMSDCAGEAMFKTVGGNRRYGAPEQFLPGYRCDPKADVWSLGMLISEMRPGRTLRRVARKALAEDPACRPADAGVLLDMVRRTKRGIAVVGTVAAVALLAALLIFLPRHQEKELPDLASLSVTHPAMSALSFPDSVSAAPGSPDHDNFLPATADPPHNPALEAEHAAIVKTLLNELKSPTDSLATLAADESLPRNVRASRMSVAIYGMNRRIASAFDSLRQHCPEDFLSRQKPGWATIFDPALSSHRDRVERILHDFSNPTDSI